MENEINSSFGCLAGALFAPFVFTKKDIQLDNQCSGRYLSQLVYFYWWGVTHADPKKVIMGPQVMVDGTGEVNLF